MTAFNFKIVSNKSETGVKCSRLCIQYESESGDASGARGNRK